MEKLSRDLLRVSRKAQICVGAVVKKYNITVAEEPFFIPCMNVHIFNIAKVFAYCRWEDIWYAEIEDTWNNVYRI